MRPLPWKVGELARRTGLSVRALHHYDEIGLLQPSLRSPAGHRLYGQGDLERLQRIQSLRSMGLALEEIRRLLADRDVSPKRILYLQLARLREQIAVQTRLAERLKSAARHLEAAEDLSVDQLCLLIEDMTTMDKYFTQEQLAELQGRADQITPERIRAVEAEWAEIIPAVRAAIDRGADPAEPEVQALAKRWLGLVEEFTGGNPEIAKAVGRMYQAEGETVKKQVAAGPDPDMFAFIGRAKAAAG